MLAFGAGQTILPCPSMVQVGQMWQFIVWVKGSSVQFGGIGSLLFRPALAGVAIAVTLRIARAERAERMAAFDMVVSLFRRMVVMTVPWKES
jgi:hypothetical protein